MRIKNQLSAYLFVLSAFCISLPEVQAQETKITRDNIRFIDYPDFPEGSSSWDDIGYNPVFNSVFVGTTNHKDKVALYEYDASRDNMKFHGFIGDLGNLRSFQWQAKIHTKFVADAQGNMYAATDGGESREEYLMDHPHGYAGGFFLKWDAANQKLVNLGMGLQYESVKDIDIDITTGKLYAVSYPQVHFTIYDPAKNDFRDLGRVGSAHVPRVMFSDQWGNCYYVDWRQRFVKYEKKSDKLLFDDKSIPAFPGTPGEHIITGITAFAKDKINNVVYFLTYGAKVMAFYPQESGIGRVKDLGGVIDVPGVEKWNFYVPNLNVGDNGKLYYFIGGHGKYAKKGYSLLMEFDPSSGEKKVVSEFSENELVEATGSDTKDKEGNMYFAGKREVSLDEKTKNKVFSEAGSKPTVPFLIKFNPGKKIN